MKRRKRLKIGDKVRTKMKDHPDKVGWVVNYDDVHRWWWVAEVKGRNWGLPYRRDELELLEPIIDKDYEGMFI